MNTPLPLREYDHILVQFSGGKDSLATILALVDAGVDMGRVQLWHQSVDGDPDAAAAADGLMDWPCTPGYCRAVAAHLGLPLLTMWKDGGFEREMDRADAPTAGVTYDGAERTNGERSNKGLVHLPAGGKPGTRGLFPLKTSDLSLRWCSAYLKIDVAARVIRNEPRFLGQRTLVLTGERREESGARAKYPAHEPHRTHLDRSPSGHSGAGRHVDHARIVLDWTEEEVWERIRRHGINPHPCYWLGFGRCSCIACLAGDTEVVTRNGIRRIEELSGTRPELLIPKKTQRGLSGESTFREADVLPFGVQRLYRITMHRNRQKKEVLATAGHRWLIRDRRMQQRKYRHGQIGFVHASVEQTTLQLQTGDFLRIAKGQSMADTSPVPFAFAQGFCFGDAILASGKRPSYLSIHDWEKDSAMLPYFAGHEIKEVKCSETTPRNNETYHCITGLPRLWKKPPDFRESRSFLLSWLAGYFAADGCVSESGQAKLDSARPKNIQLVRSIAAICGVGYGPMRSVLRVGKGKGPTRLYTVNLDTRQLPDWFFLIGSHRERINDRKDRRSAEQRHWVVDSVEPTDREETVYCAVVPDVQAFGLADELMTGNCIFGDADQWRTVAELDLPRFLKIANRERASGKTIDRRLTVIQQAGAGTVTIPPGMDHVRALAMGRDYPAGLVDARRSWTLPAGAFQRGGGPT